MGAIGGASGSGSGTGLQGPAGPQGPMGPAGPPGIADVSGTALSVFTQAVMTPSAAPFSPTIWTPLDFAVKEWDTHWTLVHLPDWRWNAPMRGVYQLQASILLQAIAGTPTWDLRVLRSGQERAQASFAGLAGQISWTGIVNPGEFLQVVIRPSSPIPVLIDGGPPRSCITIAGVGVVP